MDELFLNLHFTSPLWEFLLPIILIVADVFTGLAQALMNNDFQSKKMREGLYHKGLEMLIIGLGFIFSVALNAHYIYLSIVVYICIMEIGSILENLHASGIELGPLTKILKTIGQDEIANVIDDVTKKDDTTKTKKDK